MIAALRAILEGAVQHLQRYITMYLPATLAASILILSAWVIAWIARWLLCRLFKGMAIDRFLRQTGLAFVIDRSGRLRSTKVVAESVYWCILLTGILMGINVFDTDLTTQVSQSLVFLVPKLVVAGLILLAGLWLSQYLGRSMLVWAVNEAFPSPRRLAAVVRILVMFIAVVVAAYQLDFARPVFLTAFILVAAGTVFTVSMAVVPKLRSEWRRSIEKKKHAAGAEERSLWSHL